MDKIPGPKSAKLAQYIPAFRRESVDPSVGDSSQGFDETLLVCSQLAVTAISDLSLIPSYQSAALVSNANLTESIPHSLGPFPNETMTSEDWRYLEKLLHSDLSDHLKDGSSSVLLVRNIAWKRHELPHPATTSFPWPTFSLLSMTFRYTSLTFASYSGTNERFQTLRYLGKFYEHARDAISRSSLVEIVSASYPILLYTYKSQLPFNQVFVHFKGICAALVSPLFKRLPVHDRRQLQSYWQASLPVVRRAYWTSHSAESIVGEDELLVLKEVYATLRVTSFMLYADTNQREYESRELRLRLDTPECYLEFYWDYYLAIRCRSPTLALSESSGESALLSLETSIRDVIQLIYVVALQQPPSAEIIAQVSRISSITINFQEYPDVVLPGDAGFDHVRAAFMYSWAKVVEIILLASTNNAGRIHSSFCLLRLVNCVIQLNDGWPWRLTHSLFLCGLSLTKNRYPLGKACITMKLIGFSQRMDHFKT